MATIVFTTCDTWPTLFDSDAIIAQALQDLGHAILPVRWQGDFTPFQRADLIIGRAHWGLTPKNISSRGAYAHLSPCLASILRNTHRLAPHGMHYKMAFSDPTTIGQAASFGVVSIGGAELAELEAFYQESYPGN